ncbi:hypothetical protein [Clostridium rectalis]|uniref:hypothetical protein n=1 Tax=Clostridium rectalis TaxID=2040295 RepID=UPI000F631522|nr:hypothetical protein [Clostridium rectalis]
MNFLDEILKEMVKECEKERNDHQEKLKEKKDIKEQVKQNKINNAFRIDLSDMKNKVNKQDSKNTNYQNILDKKEKNIDNRKDLKKGDIVRIIKGEYKGITKECEFLEYCKGMDKMLLKLDELNPLYVNPEDIELVRKAITQYDIKYSKPLSDIASMVIIDDTVVKNRYDEKLNLLVQTEDKIKIYCNDKINIMSFYHIVNNLNQKAKENIKIIKCWEE